MSQTIKLLFRLNKDEKEEIYLGMFRTNEAVNAAIESDKKNIIKEYKDLYEYFQEPNPDYSLNEYEYRIEEKNFEELK